MASHPKLSIEPADLDHVLAPRWAPGVLLALLAAGALLAWRLAAA